MEAVEINAGAWYLRALRDDDRVTDRPALALAGVTDPDYVRACERGWDDETRFTWAVCEPTTGEMLAEIAIEPLGDEGEACLTGYAREGYDEPLAAARPVVRRFAEGALGYTIVG
ncbi:hypothetical protein [Williamsia sp. 1135]|uniref:hypothetical protein n=1 Tax=Williamsia sp. 1135 TaxID=1889262 RepID=UPI000A10CDE0|nr:hypothetical protein [Williamsia sp. 1135]ORM25988.1 hypothetical protein BFL43_24060 [Williamsia sp. 1135]